jgi:hypothetical protein
MAATFEETQKRVAMFVAKSMCVTFDLITLDTHDAKVYRVAFGCDVIY